MIFLHYLFSNFLSGRLYIFNKVTCVNLKFSGKILLPILFFNENIIIIDFN